METVLIVDDNEDFRWNLSNTLKDEGYNVITASEGRKALRKVEENSPNLVLLDIKLPGMDGMQVLEKMRKIDKDLIIIMITAYGGIKGAVKAMKSGAFDYITKPFDNEELILTLKKALKTQYLSREVDSLRKRLYEKAEKKEVMGESPQIKKVLNQVEIIAPTNMSVIIQGKSGTGKELIANMIHQKSPRKDGPFIAIDCGAIPDTLVESELFGYEKGAFTGADFTKKGKFEQADGGTLLLDEMTNLSADAQAKLLRAIEERKIQHIGGKKSIKVDVRIIVTTNLNLLDAVRQGRFRDDLFHRLNEFQISLPLLRERKDDIPVLAREFLNKANIELKKKIKGFSAEAIKLLLNYHWPGSVRELRHVVKRAVLLTESGYIMPEQFSLDMNKPQDVISLPKSLDEGTSFENIIRKVERDLIIKAIELAGGNKTKAANILNMNRKMLYRKVKSLGVPR